MDKFRYALFFLVAIILTLGSIASAEEQAIENGIAWLVSTQTLEGYWGEEQEALYNSFVDTCTVASTLKYLGSTDTPYASAIDWISSIEVPNNDYLCQQIEALA